MDQMKTIKEDTILHDEHNYNFNTSDPKSTVLKMKIILHQKRSGLYPLFSVQRTLPSAV